MKYVVALLITLASAFALANDIEQTYQLGAGDRIDIRVYGEEELSMEVLLASSGKIDYPYLGRIQAGGKTADQLQREIETGLKGDYLINPKVRVSVIEFRQIYVNGEVKKPGGYPYQPGLTVEKAVALAGGFSERASKSGIVLTPGDNQNQSRKVNLKDKVNPGDVLVVEQSFF